MHPRSIVVAVITLLPAGAAPDVWDLQTVNDDGMGTRNELIHGSAQFHDLAARAGVPDQDWFRLAQDPYSSYEVVVDAAAAAGGAGPEVRRLGSDGVTLLQAGAPVGVGPARSLRWQNASGSPVTDQYLRVTSGGCTTTCSTADVYRVRLYDTTWFIPRFNNAGGQVSVLVVQNPVDSPVDGTIYFWSGAGALLATQPLALAARATLSLNTAGLSALAGQSGTITITSDARYGDLAGKTVSLDPAGGFSFDAAMTPRVPAALRDDGATVDAVAPATPLIAGTTPASPSTSTNPFVFGTAETGSLVRLFTTPACSGAPVASGSATAFAAPGLPVTVTQGTTTTFRATATDAASNTSACSAGLSYTSVCPDADGDGITTCGGDCCDSDANAKPGQTSFFTVPTSCGGYDYNCDGNETQRFTAVSDGGPACFGSPPCFAAGGIGWMAGPAPGCTTPATSASFRDCNTSNCSTVTVPRTQSCR